MTNTGKPYEALAEQVFKRLLSQGNDLCVFRPDPGARSDGTWAPLTDTTWARPDPPPTAMKPAATPKRETSRPSSR